MNLHSQLTLKINKRKILSYQSVREELSIGKVYFIEFKSFYLNLAKMNYLFVVYFITLCGFGYGKVEFTDCGKYLFKLF